MREQFSQLLTSGHTLTNNDTDMNNNWVASHTGETYTIVLNGFMGSGNGNDVINVTVNGTTFDIACGNLINMSIEKITVNGYKLVTTSGSWVNTVGGTTLSQNPGILVYGYSIRKTMFD